MASKTVANNDLVGKKFVNTKMTGRPICVVLSVCEHFQKDVIFRTEDGSYTNREFATFVRRNLVNIERIIEISRELPEFFAVSEGTYLDFSKIVVGGDTDASDGYGWCATLSLSGASLFCIEPRISTPQGWEEGDIPSEFINRVESDMAEFVTRLSASIGIQLAAEI